MSVWNFSCAVLGLLLAPLLPGIINRTKAVFAGRRGPSLLQAYYDLAKLLRKGAVYSRTTTWVFRLAPPGGLACVAAALLLVPVGDFAAPLAFPGDLVLLAYLLGLMRFTTVCAALDTGSSFEGMGASREIQFAALAEPALILGLAALAYATGSFSLSGILGGIAGPDWLQAGPALLLVAAGLLIVFLAENCRIPVDDPNTHLELTMIHEVMVLDHGGPDLAFILYGGALKLWLLGALVANIFLPLAGFSGPAQVAGFVAGVFIVAVVTGVIESVMARLSLLKVPQLLVGAAILSIVGFVLMLRFVP
ncbi:MAG: NADH-quinone oxidoreductase subunit H [Thermoguttaceae bacterium]